MGNFEAKWDAFVDILIKKGGYTRVIEGLKNTGIIAVLGLAIGIFIGTLIAISRVVPKDKLITRILEKIGIVYVAFFRGTPIVVQLLLGYYVIFPLMGAHITSLNTCVVIFGLNSGAYVSEIMRGGILSVDSGQMEAGRALGFNYSSSMLKIVVPQAVKNILPTLGNEFISLIKETSVVSFVGAVDIYTAFRYFGSRNYEYMIPYLVMAAVYIIIVLIITFVLRLMERWLRRSEH